MAIKCRDWSLYINCKWRKTIYWLRQHVGRELINCYDLKPKELIENKSFDNFCECDDMPINISFYLFIYNFIKLFNLLLFKKNLKPKIFISILNEVTDGYLIFHQYWLKYVHINKVKNIKKMNVLIWYITPFYCRFIHR